jgi:phosphoribosyl 1,2-cyclic phosphodiesterase
MPSVGDPFRMRVKFWGVRGSTPTPQVENLGFGGNTPCLEIRGPNNELLIFDGGTGLRQLGYSLIQEFQNDKLFLNFFLTHFHWDHIQGIPFFAPIYHARNEMNFFSLSNSMREVLEGQMSMPYFPVNFESVASKRNFVCLEPDPLKCGGITVHTFALNHPQGCIGYRLECAGAVLVYASDTEHGNRKMDSLLRDFAQDADVLIHDAQYTAEEYESHRGWGHTTSDQAVCVALDAKVKQLILFHHDPSHDDRFLFELVQKARLRFENTYGAREGWVVDI